MLPNLSSEAGAHTVDIGVGISTWLRSSSAGGAELKAGKNTPKIGIIRLAFGGQKRQHCASAVLSIKYEVPVRDIL